MLKKVEPPKGFVISDETRNRFLAHGSDGVEWTEIVEVATRYARRIDAERVCQSDDACRYIFSVERVLEDCAR